MAKITLTCEKCQQTFERDLCQHRANTRRGRIKTFCSRECANKVHSKPIKYNVPSERIEACRNARFREECTQCGAKALRVIESKLDRYSNRRRVKECEVCNHRAVTYEITMEQYLRLDKSRKEKPCVCLGCVYNTKNRCDFDFPEYMSPDAEDCIHAA